MERITAIRLDKAVGRGSCSSIDECWSYQQLLDGLDKDNIKMPKDAVIWARKVEGIWLERGLDARWGEDTDPQLVAYEEFDELCKENKV